MSVEALKRMIDSQREENIRLYEIFQYRLHDENMQPLINDWRDGSRKLKELLYRLYELEKAEKKSDKSNMVSKKQAREITSSTYIRADRRLSKEIMSFIGGVTA